MCSSAAPRIRVASGEFGSGSSHLRSWVPTIDLTVKSVFSMFDKLVKNLTKALHRILQWNTLFPFQGSAQNSSWRHGGGQSPLHPIVWTVKTTTKYILKSYFPIGGIYAWWNRLANHLHCFQPTFHVMLYENSSIKAHSVDNLKYLFWNIFVCIVRLFHLASTLYASVDGRYYNRLPEFRDFVICRKSAEVVQGKHCF